MSFITSALGFQNAPKRVTTSVFTLLPITFGGLLFIVIPLIIFGNSLFSQNFETVNGTVTSVESRSDSDGTVYAPVVEYKVAGETYLVERSYYSSSRPMIGDEFTVLYDPTDPANAKFRIGGFEWLFVIGFPLIGLGVIVGGVYSYMKSKKRTEVIEGLVQDGYKITGILADIQKTGSRNKQNHYRLIVAADGGNGEVKQFFSDKIRGLPLGLIGLDVQSASVPIDVYYNPMNPTEYYVDLTDIPKLTPERINELVETESTD